MTESVEPRAPSAEPSLTRRSALDARPCMSCGAPLAGPYCAACGQRARDGRLTLLHVAQQVVADLSPVDHGIVYTALAVLRRPGRMARDYVDGCTVRYVGPVKYFMLLVGAAQLLALRVGLVSDVASALLEGWYRDQPGVPDPARAALVDVLTRYFVSIAAAGVPLFAAATRLLFRRARLTYAEHLVLALYTGAQQIALFTLVTAVGPAVPARLLEAVYFPLAFAYQVWALGQFTGTSAARSAWRTVAAAGLALLLGMVLFGLVFAAVDGSG